MQQITDYLNENVERCGQLEVVPVQVWRANCEATGICCKLPSRHRKVGGAPTTKTPFEAAPMAPAFPLWGFPAPTALAIQPSHSQGWNTPTPGHVDKCVETLIEIVGAEEMNG